ncbi:MAG: UDP-2,3-diacylglucosamine diphosphatase [Candidatus Coatesbacteria bacterium]|nr:UDP-2,3-diacylglucosamine diphosphatase [Candidatus Coatesbacteria bacterium]
MNELNDKIKCYRSVFISDIHLGTWVSQAEKALDFLKNTECEYLFVVGDLIDIWELKKEFYWPQEHNNLIRHLLKKARTTKITFIPGNHDEFFRQFNGYKFGGITIRNHSSHKLLDGKKFIIVHGDEFEAVVRFNKWFAMAGDAAYTVILRINKIYNILRKNFGYKYWSLSGFIKQKLKDAVDYISDYEKLAVVKARLSNADGIICGHIHKPNLKRYDKIIYCNTGDWVDSCSVLVETNEGKLKILFDSSEETIEIS